jgi:sigma-B regulation protein RsbU (phosphoserine phosphatase)
LPPSRPAFEGYEIAVEYHPAYEVGGDLYDFAWHPSTDTLQVVVGDVSGKSIPAALYGAVFSGHLRSLLAHPLPPSETLAFLNASLIERYQVSNYIAVADLRLRRSDGNGFLANGGMPYPFLVHDGDASQVTVPGIPLGLVEGTLYEQVPVFLERGDTLLLASDGATDATNINGEMYEEERFLESIRRHCARATVEFVRSLYQDITGFIGSAELQDDVTILAIRRLT